MKKKILTLSLALAMAATAIVGASLAYFTDTDEQTNTFTVGNVQIDLIEQQRKLDADGKKTTDLEDFTDGKLLPIVGSAQGDKDELGMPVAANYVDKMITVKNTGTEDAWVRVYFAIPAALDDGYETFNAGLNVLHFNTGSYQKADGTWDNVVAGGQWIRKFTSGTDTKWNYFETTMDGIAYNVYYGDYYQPLGAGKTTERFVDGVYLDKSFDYADGTYYAFGQALTLDNGWDWSEVQCPVFAVAVQAAGFDSAAAAITEAFGAHYNPWGTAVTNWQE